MSDKNDNINIEDSNYLTKVGGMYKEWFLEYASYVILERAVPDLMDGLKPVQRRILHSMFDLEDGRYNKVANIVGHTMQYHPHGDASISDAIVQVGQKELLIDMQGNWGNIYTGDSAAASRYIEARLSKFALEVVFNPKTTNWQLSYDGRKKEPVHLPVKFPLLLAQGAEGIAVGLSTKILPHNFNELIDGSVKYLKGRSFKLFPDFQTGGSIDVSNYNDGNRGGRVKVRATLEKYDKSTIVIKEIPYGTTTASLIESIIKASEKGKVKIKKIEDNTSAEVEILVYLPSGASIQKTIDSLFAFTQCEVSISPLCCVISDNKPQFLGVRDMLKISTDNTKNLLKKELEIQLDELENQWHYISLERIFIENRIYREIEEKTTWDEVLSTIDSGLDPFKSKLKKDITVDDIKKLTEIPIRKISKFDLNKVKDKLDSIEVNIEEVKNNLNHLIEYTIKYFTHLKKYYGKDNERKTKIDEFDELDKKTISIKNYKLYVNKAEGFVGTSLKKDEFVCDCSDLDDIIVFTSDGIMKVVKVDSKLFVGRNILHVSLFNSKSKETLYNLIYRDGKSGTSYMKRFKVSGVIRDKEYNLTQGKEGSEVLYFSKNIKDEADIVTVYLRNRSSLKKLKWELDFADLTTKGRDSKGNIVTKYNIRKISYKEKNKIGEKIKDIKQIDVNDEKHVKSNDDESQTRFEF
ncbi:MAG: DNA gyrase/topoisomerase IV subunit A [Bacteroidetes bacterium]|nr:DNA gyrase/topoisomerase IV subunit A [Bacteroidota bacterium]MDA0885474.1 DNA gyrase/topoisomerase IV subunit A [Bacteroidota bacterium]